MSERLPSSPFGRYAPTGREMREARRRGGAAALRRLLG